MSKSEKTTLTREKFFKVAIIRLRDKSKSLGIHSVFSGFNEAFREHFKEDPIKVTQELAGAGKIETRFVKGGVMIYLPGEAPKLRGDVGKAALAKILNEPSEDNRGLVDSAVAHVAPGDPKLFPEGFVETSAPRESFEVAVPGSALQVDANLKNIVLNSARSFRYEAKNPSQAKYIVYAHRIGEKTVRVPKDNQVVFKAVTSYEHYCKEIREQSFNFLLSRTGTDAVAQVLSGEVAIRLGLKA
jgi:hypothetical protein